MLMESETWKSLDTPVTANIETYIIQELCTSVSLNVMSIKVTPTKLNVYPILIASSSIEHVFDLWKEWGGEQDDIIRPSTHVGDQWRPRDIPLNKQIKS